MSTDDEEGETMSEEFLRASDAWAPPTLGHGGWRGWRRPEQLFRDQRPPYVWKMSEMIYLFTVV